MVKESVINFFNNQASASITAGKIEKGIKNTYEFAKKHSKEAVALGTAIFTVNTISPVFSQEQTTSIPRSNTTIESLVSSNSSKNFDIDASKIIGLSKETVNSVNAYKRLQPITTAEDFYNGTAWNQSVVSDYLDILNPEYKDQYLYIGEPDYAKTKNASFLKQNWERGTFYNIKNVPSFVVNGYYDRNKIFYDTEGLKFISEGIKKAKQYATMEIKQVQDDNYLFKITGTDKGLNGRKLNVNVLVLKNEVNCDDNNDYFRTRILKRVVYQYVYDKAMGTSIKLENGQEIIQSINIKVPKVDQNQCDILGIIQDMNSGEILAAGYTDMIDSKPALFNIDNLPECTLGNIEDTSKYTGVDTLAFALKNKVEFQDKIGLTKKIISVTDAKDLKHLSLQLDYTDTEAKIYQVLAAALNPELMDNATFTYDPITNKVDIFFINPINGNKELLYFYIRINKATINGIKDKKNITINSVNFKFSEFYAYDSNNNLIKYNIREQKNYFPVRMCTIPDPSDFNGDAEKDKDDLFLMMKKFGTRLGDKDYQEKFNLVNDGFSKDRIDIADVCKLNQEIGNQEKIQKEIDTAKKLQKARVTELQKFEARKAQKANYLQAR